MGRNFLAYYYSLLPRSFLGDMRKGTKNLC